MLFVWILILGVLGGGGTAGWYAWQQRQAQYVKRMYREAEIVKGDLVETVNSTGTVQPVTSVQIGAFVSGPIEQILVDFNSVVKAGDVLAKIDPRLIKASVARDEAGLAHRTADLARVTALYDRAFSEERRALTLRARGVNSMTESDIEQYIAERKSLAAQLDLAKASIQEAEANLSLSRANLEYTIIKSPTDGVVIDRKVDPGQTVAAQFQTPTLFVVAPDLDRRVHVYAAVDEADVGQIRKAQDEERSVDFTVDAYPEQLFSGKIGQIRLNPSNVQNVITYTVIVEAPNDGSKLLPGMTANLSFRILERRDVRKIPNAALRFFPKPAQVHPEDRDILERRTVRTEEAESATGTLQSAEERATNARDARRRHVWVAEGEFLRAVEVFVGISDNRFTELTEGKLEVGAKLVVGLAR